MGGVRRVTKKAMGLGLKTIAKPVTQVAKAAGIVDTPKAPEPPRVEPKAPAKAPAQAAAESVTSSPRVTPKASVAYGGSEMTADSNQTRRRRARGIRTSARGVTGAARTARKTLLGE